jgi:hypothetical protein
MFDDQATMRRSSLPTTHRTPMRLTLEQLTLAELRDICRQHDLPDTYNADDMKQRIRDAVTAVTLVTLVTT